MRRLLLAVLLVAGAFEPTQALDQGGSIETWVDAHDDGDPTVLGWFRATYSLDTHVRPWMFVKLAAIFELNTNDDFARDTLYDDPDRNLKCAPLRFRDLALGVRAGETTFVVGKQRLTWKRATFVNATDNLTPRDWTDPLDEQR